MTPAEILSSMRAVGEAYALASTVAVTLHTMGQGRHGGRDSIDVSVVRQVAAAAVVQSGYWQTTMALCDQIDRLVTQEDAVRCGWVRRPA